MERNNFFKRFMSLFLMIVILFGTVLTPFSEVSAHEAAVLQPLIDAEYGGYVLSIDYEDSGTFKGGHKQDDVFLISSSNLELKNLIKNNLGTDKTKYSDVQFSNSGGTKNDYMTLGWPGKDKNATNADFQRASTVGQTLVTTLNSLLNYATYNSLATQQIDPNNKKLYSMVISNTIGVSNALDPAFDNRTGSTWDTLGDLMAGTEGVKNPDASSLKIDMKNYAPSSKSAVSDDSKYREVVLGNRVFVYCIDTGEVTLPLPGVNEKVDGGNPNTGDLYVYMYDKGTKAGSTEFTEDAKASQTKGELIASRMVWAMPKGYSSEFLTLRNIPGENDYVTCFMISGYANALALKNGEYISAAGALTNNEPNFLLKLLYNVFDGLLAGLRSILGLRDMDELIFNSGERGGKMYEYGMMHKTWWATVLKYFTIMQLIAWMAIALAIAKILIQVNIGSISQNSRQRADLMDSIMRFIAVGLLLTLCIPIVRLMMMVNNALVGVFSASYAGKMSQIPQSSNFLVGLVMMMFWFGMQFYVNFIYIMRSIMLAILVAMGPFFIVTMAFSKKGLFENWIKEVAANIFLQAFHAFAFSFLFEVIVSGGRWIERIAVVWAIFPLTDFFRTMVFGQSGSFAVNTGKQLGETAKNLTQKAAGTAVGLAAGGAVGAVGIKKGFTAGSVASAGLTGEGGSTGGPGGGGGRTGGGGMADRIKQFGDNMTETGDSLNASSQEIRKGVTGDRMMAIGQKLSAVGGIASGIGSAVGGMDKIASGMAMGDGHAMREGAQQTGGAVGGAIGKAAGRIPQYAVEKYQGTSSQDGVSRMAGKDDDAANMLRALEMGDEVDMGGGYKGHYEDDGRGGKILVRTDSHGTSQVIKGTSAVDAKRQTMRDTSPRRPGQNNSGPRNQRA